MSNIAREIAQRYVDDCEAYDRTVCTGPIECGEILPADYRELGLINQFAQGRWQQMKREADAAGIDFEAARRWVPHCRPS